MSAVLKGPVAAFHVSFGHVSRKDGIRQKVQA
jgi:hypothetical protein